MKIVAQQDTTLLQDLSSAWIRYDDNSLVQAFSDDGISSGGFFLLSDNLDQQLLYVCGVDFDVWVNSRLLTSSRENCQIFELAELANDFQSDTLYFTISSESFATLKASLLRVEESVEARYELPIARDNRLQELIWLLFFVCLLVFGAILKGMHEPTFRQLLTGSFWRGKLDADATPALSLANLLLIVLAALLVGFQQSAGIEEGVSHALRTFLISAGYVLVFMLLKIFVIRAIARLFRFYRFDGAQIREYLFFLNSLLLFILLVEWVAFWFFEYHFTNPLFGSTFSIIISLLFLFWLFFRFPRALSNRNLHIISYLCATEILPTFVLASWLLN